jgi:hypothetical protein
VSVVVDGSTFAAFDVGTAARRVGETLRSEPLRCARSVVVSAFGGDASSVWAPPEVDITTPSATSTVVCDGDDDVAPDGFGESGVDGVSADEDRDALVGGDFTLDSAPEAGEPEDAASDCTGAVSVVVALPEPGLAQATPVGTAMAAPTPNATANAPTRPTYRALPTTDLRCCHFANDSL